MNKDYIAKLAVERANSISVIQNYKTTMDIITETVNGQDDSEEKIFKIKSSIQSLGFLLDIAERSKNKILSEIGK